MFPGNYSNNNHIVLKNKNSFPAYKKDSHDYFRDYKYDNNFPVKEVDV